MSKRALRGILSLTMGLAVSLAGCEPAPVSEVPATGCSENAAMIGVYDGFLQIECGCAEQAGVAVHPPEELVCTVSPETSVTFQFTGAFMEHQILSEGEPRFVSSPPTGTMDDRKIHTHAVTLEEAGTYEFSDAFFPDLQGAIVVQ